MYAGLTYADVFRPSTKIRAFVYDALLITAGSLLIAASAQLSIGWPVPITGQTFAVLFLAALFGPNRAVFTVILYLTEGLAGLPVFANARFGSLAMSGPTGGYLVGFIFAAFVVGLLAKKGFDKTFGGTVVAMLAGNIIIYAFGLMWLTFLVSAGSVGFGYRKILAVGLIPFIPGDIIKIIIAAALLPAGWKLLKK